MPKIIFKSTYLQSDNGAHAKSYVKYIATRDGVEKIEDAWKTLPATQSQQKFIRQFVKDFPSAKNSFEYEDFLKEPTRASASIFITAAIDAHADQIGKRENYVGYIAKRPRVEKRGEHGLFSDTDAPIQLGTVAREVAEHDGNVWTNVISLRREDAARLGYDRAEAWQTLLRSHAQTFAEQMKIPLEDLRWYAAFHNESWHPHCHMIAYSKGKEPYLSKQGIDGIRSALARDIFKQDLIQVYKEQTEARNTLTAESWNAVAEIVRQINSGGYDNPAVEELLVKLADRLASHKGKKQYGYLDQPGRNMVNAVVDELAKDERIAQLYDLWYQQREAVLSTYRDEMPERVPLSQNSEFKSVRNAVVNEAVNILLDRLTFEEASEEEPDESVTAEPASDEPEIAAQVTTDDKPENMYILYRRAKTLLDQESPEYDPQEAIRLLIQSAQQGYEWAQYRLGKIFLHGDPVEQDIQYGLKWLNEAEAQNNQYAQVLLGRTYLKGELVPRDIGMAEAMFAFASDQGNADAQYALAKLHLGRLAEKSDIFRAVDLLEASAKGGNEWAQYTLGKLLMRGEMIPKDTVRAERLLLDAVRPRPSRDGGGRLNPGNQYAAYLLGRLYLSEDGIPKDAEKAVRYLGESADQGNQWAQYQLGKMLLYGKEVEQDVLRGLTLLDAASRQGNIYADKVVQNYYSYGSRTRGSAKTGAALGSLRLLGYLARLVKNRLDEEARHDGEAGLIETKLRREIEAKKQSHGQRMS